MEDLSCVLFGTLDCIGYNQEMIKYRRRAWENLTPIPTVKFTPITAGSKAEGISTLFQSDIDRMLILKDAICTDKIGEVSKESNLTVIHADTSESPHGYTRLKVVSTNGQISRLYLKDSMFESESKDIYVSSSLFASNMKNFLMERFQDCNFLMERFQDCNLSGPAVFSSCQQLTSQDTVLALQCDASTILQKWKSRRRLNSWPPAEVREVVASMLAEVVPVGSKGSCDQWREWRFCFIESELKLTCSLNETQIKLYIVLKMVAKDILKNISNEISSYIMKNVTFWLSELLPRVEFRKGNLLALLFLSLRFLRSCISQRYMPYYMIPGRNLLAERLTDDNRQIMSDLLDALQTEGPSLILRLPKLGAAMNVSLASPALIVEHRNRRDMIEKLHLDFGMCWVRHEEDLSYVSILSRIPMLYDNVEKMCHLVMPDYGTCFNNLISAEYYIAEMLERVKSILS